MKLIIIFVIILITGCASGLNSMQRQELLGYESKGLAIEEKSTATATALGLLPGGGSFYTRNYGLGVLNLLVWPYSVLWDPISGFNGAQEINYHATLANCSKLKNSEMSDLDTLLMAKQIDVTEYTIKKHTIENKYSSIYVNNSLTENTHVSPSPSPTTNNQPSKTDSVNGKFTSD